MARLAWSTVVFRNLPAKVFALVFAFTLWFFVNAGKRETQVFQFPLELRNLPERMALVPRERVDTIAVTLNGPGALLGSLDARRAPIALDLSGVAPGSDARLKIREDMVRVPRGVRILDIEPSRVPVQLEEIRSASLPVRVARNGDLPDGYRVGGMVVSPENVTVTGPASAFANLDAVETEPLELAGLTAPTRRTLGLVRGEQLYSVVPERVTVQVAVEQIRKTRELRADVEVLNVDRPFQLKPPHVNLTVRGPEASVRELNLEPGAVSVDGTDLGVGTHTVPVAVVVPTGIELVKTDPDKLSLQILEKKTGARR